MRFQEESYRGVSYEIHAKEADHRWSVLVMIDFPGALLPPMVNVESSYPSTVEAFAAGHKAAQRLIDDQSSRNHH